MQMIGLMLRIPLSHGHASHARLAWVQGCGANGSMSIGSTTSVMMKLGGVVTMGHDIDRILLDLEGNKIIVKSA